MVTKKKVNKRTANTTATVPKSSKANGKKEVTLSDVKEAFLGYFRGGWSFIITIVLAILIVSIKPIMLDQIVTATMFAALATLIAYWVPRVLTRGARPHLLEDDPEGRQDRRTIWIIRGVAFIGACLLLSRFSL